MIKVLEHVITPTIFPDKTSQVWKLPTTLISLLTPTNINKLQKDTLLQTVFLDGKVTKEYTFNEVRNNLLKG